MLRGVEPHVKGLKFRDSDGIKPPAVALGSIKLKMASNEMERVHPMRIAARRDPRVAKQREQNNTEKYHLYITNFKKRLRNNIRLEMRETGNLTSVRPLFVEKLRELNLEVTADDDVSTDNEPSLMD
jgi:hypothetical protein